MHYLEHRRHAKRDKPFAHLNAVGAAEARKVGEAMGGFDLVVSSSLPRACETATAMGYGIDAESELLHIAPESIEPLADWDNGFGPIIGALKKSKALQSFADKIKGETINFIDRAGPDARLLFVSHGGMIELALIALLKNPLEIEDWRKLKKCEGWSLDFNGKEFTTPIELRLN